MIQAASRQRIVSPQYWWHHFAEHLIRCPRAASRPHWLLRFRRHRLRRCSATSWLFFLLRLHMALLQQNSFDPSTAFGVVCADSARATRAAQGPGSLTRASVMYQRFCVATGSGTSSPGASSMLTFGQARAPHCKSTGTSLLHIAVALFGLGLKKGSRISLSTHSLLHMAYSGCRLIVSCAPRARRHRGALRCFPFCPTRQAPASSLQTCHAAVLFQ